MLLFYLREGRSAKFCRRKNIVVLRKRKIVDSSILFVWWRFNNKGRHVLINRELKMSGIFVSLCTRRAVTVQTHGIKCFSLNRVLYHDSTLFRWLFVKNPSGSLANPKLS